MGSWFPERSANFLSVFFLPAMYGLYGVTINRLKCADVTGISSSTTTAKNNFSEIHVSRSTP